MVAVTRTAVRHKAELLLVLLLVWPGEIDGDLPALPAISGVHSGPSRGTSYINDLPLSAWETCDTGVTPG